MSNATSTARLAHAAEVLTRIGEAAKRSLTHALATTGARVLDEMFNRSQGPDGEAWQPLRRRAGDPLVGQRRLQRGFEVRPSAAGITVRLKGIPEDLFRAHNEGADIPPREVAPREVALDRRTNRFLSASRARKRSFVFTTQAPTVIRGWRLVQRRMMPEGGAVPTGWGVRFNADAREWMRRYLEGASG